MVIEHVAMYVNDLGSAKDFFIKYLGGSSNAGIIIQIQGSDPISFLLMME